MPMNRLLTETREMQTPSSSGLALYLNQQPKDITKGFVFGSDPRTCDVLLAKSKSTGISGNHFSIHVDWVSRKTMITCLSSNRLRVRFSGWRKASSISQGQWRRLDDGTTTMVHVNEKLGATLLSPTRGDLQAAYDRKLHECFLEYKNAVPELAAISLCDDEVTPLILNRCTGLQGHQYYSISMNQTGDPHYDSKVFIYDAECKLTPNALKEAQGRAEVGDHSSYANKDWLLSHSKGGRPGEVCVVKHFRDRTHQVLPDQLPELCRLSHLNLEDLVDFIIEPSVFMVVTDVFPRTTLYALHQQEPLTTEEAGFVMGQTFAALEYLHARRWAHGNLDPRSIHVLSRKHLWIKLTDYALSKYVDLGKPDGYHALYSSQQVSVTDKRPADIWSAGVVAMSLILPSGLPCRTNFRQTAWVQRLERLAADKDRRYGNDATAFVRNVLKWDVGERPKAGQMIEHPWIVQTRGEASVKNPHYDPFSPQGSRHTSVGPSDAPSRQDSATPSNKSSRGDATPESGHPNAGIPHGSNFQSPAASSIIVKREEHASGSRPASVGPSRHSSRHGSVVFLGSATPRQNHQHPYPEDGYGDFDSDHGRDTSRSSSRFTANPLAREPHLPRPYRPNDSSSAIGGTGSSRGGWGTYQVSDWGTGTVGAIDEQAEAESEEDSGEETERDERGSR